ncbi:hypothetical protein M3Y94_00580800 [Aphelenchoides besseyi]|nr:hypothetical protein M3Y94_00580800 [Aphelenchoides besseyi]KAI6222024.1 hypothetical protein M3Y95_00940700 [Aphelenchoides besseyi]
MVVAERRSRVYILRRCAALLILGIVCLTFWRDMTPSNVIVDEQLPDYFNQTGAVYCDGESFAYRHISLVNSNNRIQVGRPFDCSKISYLRRFKLTQDYAIQSVIPSNGLKEVVFVGAVDSKYWTAMRVAFSTVREHFGKQNKFILYDLGGVKETYGTELTNLCNLEVRTFDFNTLPKDVRDLQTFSWKVFILAEMFAEGVDVIYLDSSLYFTSGQWNLFFQSMNDRFRLTPFQLSGDTGHGLKYATDKRMYDFIPLDLNVIREDHMFEANLILMHRSELTRQLLKWSVLCAVTRDCINPTGSFLGCDGRRDQESVCHRQDQSIFNILVYNMEANLRRYGFPVIAHGAQSHPKNTKSRHETRRGQYIDAASTPFFTC